MRTTRSEDALITHILDARSILLAVAQDKHARYFATFCITSGTYAMLGAILAWCGSTVLPNLSLFLPIVSRTPLRPHRTQSCSADALHLFSSPVSHNLGSESKKAAGIPLYMALGQCGAVLGSHLYPLTQGPRYTCAFLSLSRRCDIDTPPLPWWWWYRRGFATNCALDVLAAALALALTVCSSQYSQMR